MKPLRRATFRVHMPRHARTVAAGYPHVILRGIDRAAIFFADTDRYLFLATLAELALAESVGVHAYVLMTNHIHLLMTPGTESGVSRLMKGLGQRYVQHVNRNYRRSGPLFEGCFRSALLGTDGYLLASALHRAQPVAGGYGTSPGRVSWSSYTANALGHRDPVVSPIPLYTALGETDATRQLAYRALFADALPDAVLRAIRDATNGGFALVNEPLQRQIAVMVGRRTWRGKSGRPKRSTDADQPDLPILTENRGLSPISACPRFPRAFDADFACCNLLFFRVSTLKPVPFWSVPDFHSDWNSPRQQPLPAANRAGSWR